jgi:hypothetical protein
MTRKQKKALEAHAASQRPIGSWKSSLSGMATLRKQAAEKKSKHKIIKSLSLGSAYHAGRMEGDRDRVEFYLTILNDLAEDIEISGRLTRANLAEVLGWMSREQGRMNDHMCGINNKLLVLAADSLISAMKDGLFRDVPASKAEKPDKIAALIEQCAVLSKVDREILCYHVSKAVLSTQHEQQQRTPAVGLWNPVEAAINPVQQPARPGSGLSRKH